MATVQLLVWNIRHGGERFQGVSDHSALIAEMDQFALANQGE